jgi:hypothetical protein
MCCVLYQLIPLHSPPGDTSKERTVQIDGSSDQIEAAKQMVNDFVCFISFSEMWIVGLVFVDLVDN